MEEKKNVRNLSLHSFNEPIIFDSIGIHFHLTIFFFQLIVHIFPLILFCSPISITQGVDFKNIVISRYKIFITLCFYVMIITYWLCSADDRALLGYSILYTTMFFIVDCVMEAFKYSTLSATEYDRFMRCQDYEVSREYAQQLELLSGWLTMDDMVLQFELAAASARVGAMTNTIFFHIPANEADFWNNFLKATELRQLLSDGVYGVSVFDVCACIIKRSHNTDQPLLKWLMRLIHSNVLIMVVALYIPLFTNRFETISQIYIGCNLLSATVITYEYGRYFFLLLYVAVLDISRFLHMTQDLHSLIRVNREVSAQSNETMDAQSRERPTAMTVTSLINQILHPAEGYTAISTNDMDDQLQNGNHDLVHGSIPEDDISVDVPKVDLHIPANANAWVFCRLAIQHFGERYRHRTNSYIGKIGFQLL